jgi:hypothetical protein
MEINYYIDNIEVEKPINHAELGIEINYDMDDSANQSVSITEFEFGVGSQVEANDAATLINAHRSNGSSGGGVGVFEGLPFRIELNHDGNTNNLFEGYLDTSKALFDCDKVIVTAVESGGIDWINEVFDSKSFKYIQEVEGIIIPVIDYRQVPYVLSSIPNNKEAFLALVSIALIGNSIRGEIQKLKALTSGFTAWPVGGQWIEAGFQVAWIITLVVLLVQLIKQMIDLLIQPVKYVACMSELSLCQRGSQSFGFTFKSSILENAPYKDSYIIPEKYNHDIKTNNNKVEIFGFTDANNPSEGFYKGTFGELLRKLKNKYNAKIIIEGKTLRLEREDYNNSSYNYILPPVDQTNYRLNSDELTANYLVSFETDINDKHTIQRYTGIETQTITSPVNTINKDMVLLSGLENRSIGLTRGTRKSTLTYAEKVIRGFLFAFDGYVNIGVFTVNAYIFAINSITNTLKGIAKALSLININVNLPDLEIEPLKYSSFGNAINDRIGMLLMENDFIQIPKNVMIDVSSNPENTKVSLLDQHYNNSQILTDNFHVTRSFISSNEFPNANQYYIYSAENVPFCIDDYNLLKNSNFMQDDSNRNGKLLKCIWYPDGNQTASIDYKINKLYTTNLKEDKITPDGK